jgi:hypothetical protein
MLNWDGTNQLGYLYSMFLFMLFTLQDHFDMLIATWRTTQENSTTTRTNGNGLG